MKNIIFKFVQSIRYTFGDLRLCLIRIIVCFCIEKMSSGKLAWKGDSRPNKLMTPEQQPWTFARLLSELTNLFLGFLVSNLCVNHSPETVTGPGWPSNTSVQIVGGESEHGHCERWSMPTAMCVISTAVLCGLRPRLPNCGSKKLLNNNKGLTN